MKSSQTIFLAILLFQLLGNQVKSQYYDSRGPFGIAVDQIVANTNLGISIYYQKQKLIQGKDHSPGFGQIVLSSQRYVKYYLIIWGFHNNSWFSECTNSGACGYGAYCYLTGENGSDVGCKCKSGFRGRTRINKATVCTRIG